MFCGNVIGVTDVDVEVSCPARSAVGAKIHEVDVTHLFPGFNPVVDPIGIHVRMASPSAT